jgi:NAD(P)-dependent dehydrogenase (short-subunit alcohol dehydrogenase family)
VRTIGNGVLAVQADVAKLADLDKLYREVSQKLGKIDVLFVNAGVAKFAPLAETSESTYDEQFDINIKGGYLTIQEGTAPPERWCIDHSDQQRSRQPGPSRHQRLFSNQSSIALACANGGCRTGRTRHSRQHGCSWANCHSDFWEDRAAKGSR